jgi:hypothetical protein
VECVCVCALNTQLYQEWISSVCCTSIFCFLKLEFCVLVYFFLLPLGAAENMIVGSIPTNISNLKELGSIDIRNCSLTGHLPTELSYNNHLEYLFLGNNVLSGSIPPSWSALTNLKHLDLGKKERKINVYSIFYRSCLLFFFRNIAFLIDLFFIGLVFVFAMPFCFGVALRS